MAVKKKRKHTGKPKVCTMCGKLLKAGMMTAAGKKFCNKVCNTKFKRK